MGTIAGAPPYWGGSTSLLHPAVANIASSKKEILAHLGLSCGLCGPILPQLGVQTPPPSRAQTTKLSRPRSTWLLDGEPTAAQCSGVRRYRTDSSVLS